MKSKGWLGILLGAAFAWGAEPSPAEDKGETAAAELASKSQAALKQLYASAPLAKQLGPTAHAILVFPKVTKAGLVIGGQYGEGALLQKGTAVAYYKTTGASYGLQAGGQQYRYAMFFMNAKALDQLGFELVLRTRTDAERVTDARLKDVDREGLEAVGHR